MRRCLRALPPSIHLCHPGRPEGEPGTGADPKGFCLWLWTPDRRFAPSGVTGKGFRQLRSAYSSVRSSITLPIRDNYKMLTIFSSHHKILLTNFPVADIETAHRCERRGQVLAQQTRLHSGAAGLCFGLCSQAMHAMDAGVPTGFGRFRSPNAKKAPGASTRTSLHGSEEPPDTFSAGCPEGLPTAVSSPKAWTCGRALAGVPASPRPRRSVSWLPVRRPAYPKIRAPLSGCRFPRRFPGCRPRRPKPPGRSAFDPVPRVRFSGSSASRPKASAASATCFLAVACRVTE